MLFEWSNLTQLCLPYYWEVEDVTASSLAKNIAFSLSHRLWSQGRWFVHYWCSTGNDLGDFGGKYLRSWSWLEEFCACCWWGFDRWLRSYRWLLPYHQIRRSHSILHNIILIPHTNTPPIPHILHHRKRPQLLNRTPINNRLEGRRRMPFIWCCRRNLSVSDCDAILLCWCVFNVHDLELLGEMWGCHDCWGGLYLILDGLAGETLAGGGNAGDYWGAGVGADDLKEFAAIIHLKT